MVDDKKIKERIKIIIRSGNLKLATELSKGQGLDIDGLIKEMYGNYRN